VIVVFLLGYSALSVPLGVKDIIAQVVCGGIAVVVGVLELPFLCTMVPFCKALSIRMDVFEDYKLRGGLYVVLAVIGFLVLSFFEAVGTLWLGALGMAILLADGGFYIIGALLVLVLVLLVVLLLLVAVLLLLLLLMVVVVLVLVLVGLVLLLLVVVVVVVVLVLVLMLLLLLLLLLRLIISVAHQVTCGMRTRAPAKCPLRCALLLLLLLILLSLRLLAARRRMPPPRPVPDRPRHTKRKAAPGAGADWRTPGEPAETAGLTGP